MTQTYELRTKKDQEQKETLRQHSEATPTAAQIPAQDSPTVTALEPPENRIRQFAKLAVADATARFVRNEMRRNPVVMERLRRL